MPAQRLCRVCALSLLGATLLTTGCASLVPHRGQTAGVTTGVPQGVYTLTLHTPSTGSVEARIAARPVPDGEPGGFRANSRPGAIGQLLGGPQGFFANLLGQGTYAGGAFLHTSGRFDESTGAWHGDLRTPLGAYDIASTEEADHLVLHDDDGNLVGYADLAPAAPDVPAPAELNALVKRIRVKFDEQLYDPGLITDPRVLDFFARLERAATVARDQAEFALGFLLAARQLPFSHVHLRRALAVELPATRDTARIAEPITLQTDAAAIMTMRIPTFWMNEQEIDDAFVQVAAEAPRAVIIDLRGNPGGTYASVRVADYLLVSTIDIGVLFGADARHDVLARRWSLFPTHYAIRSPEELEQIIATYGAVIGRVRPREPHFAGPVAVLIDRATTSAAEPLAEVLQRAGRATLVGQATAGAMLSADEFDVGDGWLLAVPVYDYLTADGVRLEGQGVTPDVEIDPAHAPAEARRLLLQELE